jgi:hypothetical protein
MGEPMSVKHLRIVRAVLHGLLLLASSSFPLRTATACGTVAMWAGAYVRETTDAQRQQRLSELLCVPFYEYHGRPSDDLLLRVLSDAVARRYDKRLVQEIFEYYRCIPGASDRLAREILASYLDASACPTAEEIAQWRSVVARSVNVRADAAVNSKKVDYLMHGNVVTLVSTAGEWSRVRTWWGKEGYVLSELLEPYEAPSGK